MSKAVLIIEFIKKYIIPNCETCEWKDNALECEERGGTGFCSAEKEALNHVIEMLEKQIPKMVIYEGNSAYCPVCDKVFSDGEFGANYCSDCGQKLT